MTTKKISHALLVAFAILQASDPVTAQDQPRAVHGVVTDRRSQPIAHAAVQIQNNWTLVIRSYITQTDGKYHFAGLSPDVNYRLTAEYDGFRSHTRTLSKFDSSRNREIDLPIPLGK